MSENETWAQLVSTTDILADPYAIKSNKFFIGRSNSSDLSLGNNKLVSGTHCYIERDKLGQVWLQDCSTNGTLLNLKEKVVGKKVPLKHGDEISVVYKKNTPELNVSYLFQDLACLAEEEEDETTADSSELNTSATQPDESLNEAAESPSTTCKRKSSDLDNSTANTASRKKLKRDDTILYTTASEDSLSRKEDEAGEASASDKKASTSNKKASTSGKKASTAGKKDVLNLSTSSSDAQDEGIEENLVCIICHEIFYDCVSLQPCMHSFCAGCYSDWMERSEECPSCRLKVDRVSKNHMVNNLVEAYLKKHPKKQRPKEDTDELDKKNKIKQETHKPAAPERTVSDLMDEDEDFYNSELDEDDNEDDEDEYDDPPPAPAPAIPGYRVNAFGNVTGGYVPGIVCRQCPAYKGPGGFGALGTAGATGAGAGLGAAWQNITAVPAGGAAGAVAGPSKGAAAAGASKCGGGKAGATGAAGTSGAGEGTSTATEADHTTVITHFGTEKKMAKAPDHKCGPGQIHLLCQCCRELMPDRRNTPMMPRQECTLCRGLYCHMYWGCQRHQCTGCMAPFKEFVWPKHTMDGILLENNYESDILRNYLEGKGLNLADLFKECCDKLDSGEYTCSDSYRGLRGQTVVCQKCALRNFRDLVYHYREHIKKEDLPDGVVGRTDCHWGKSCRTQRTTPHHAANFNHICQQTKF